MKDYSDECMKCGLCCIYYPTLAKTSNHSEWAMIANDETEKVPRRLYKIIRNPQLDFHKENNINKFIKDKKDNIWKGFRRCIELEGIQTQEVKCSIYKNRPKVCSEFLPGDIKCNEIRVWGGLEELK